MTVGRIGDEAEEKVIGIILQIIIVIETATHGK